MGRNYEPHADARVLGVEVVTGRLPRGWHGAYDHARRRIVLAPGLSRREERCALTHELQHALAGDVPSPFGLITAKQERRARLGAARLLVDADEYAEAESIFGPHLSAIAHELDVTVQVVADWVALGLVAA